MLMMLLRVLVMRWRRCGVYVDVRGRWWSLHVHPRVWRWGCVLAVRCIPTIWLLLLLRRLWLGRLLLLLRD